MILFPVQDAVSAGERVTSPAVARDGVEPDGPHPGLAGAAELLTRWDQPSDSQRGRGVPSPLIDGAHRDRENQEAITGPGVPARLRRRFALVRASWSWRMGLGATHCPQRPGSSSAHRARSREKAHTLADVSR